MRKDRIWILVTAAEMFIQRNKLYIEVICLYIQVDKTRPENFHVTFKTHELMLDRRSVRWPKTVLFILYVVTAVVIYFWRISADARRWRACEARTSFC